MARPNWLDITKEDVVRAIEKFLAYNPEYPEPRSTFLVYDGKKLPAKHGRLLSKEKFFSYYTI